MPGQDEKPTLVVVAPPRKTRYSRKKSLPVDSELEAAEAADRALTPGRAKRAAGGRS